jgi:CBS domain-containing protein
MKVMYAMERDIVTVNANAEIGDVAEEMARRNIGAIPVVDGGRPIGVITANDLVSRVLALKTDPRFVRARDVMTPNPIEVHEDVDLSEAARLMKSYGVRHLLVIGDRQDLRGLFSLSDLSLCTNDAGDVLRELSERSLMNRYPEEVFALPGVATG